MTARILVLSADGRSSRPVAMRLSSLSGAPVRSDSEPEITRSPHSMDSLRIVGWIVQPGPWVIEGGYAAVRGLRKFLSIHRDRKPCESVIWIPTTTPHGPMAKASQTVWLDTKVRLLALGVEVAEGTVFAVPMEAAQ